MDHSLNNFQQIKESEKSMLKLKQIANNKEIKVLMTGQKDQGLNLMNVEQEVNLENTIHVDKL
jgi:hypothetical protein